MHSQYRRVIKSEQIKLVDKDISDSKSNITKGNHSKRLPGGKSDFDLDYVKKTFAKEIAHSEEQAFQKGFSEGVRKGKEYQKNEVSQAIHTLTYLIKELNELKQNILEKAEDQILELALGVAQKVIHMEITTNREIIQNVLKDAIRSIVDRENMKIHVNPQDFRYMMEIKSDFLQSFDGIKNIIFEEDETIGRGGATIETLFGEVDARVDQQFNEIKNFLTSSDK